MKISSNKTAKPSNKKRGGNFTTMETMHLKVVPINRDEWQLIANKHMLKYPEFNRDVEGSRRKYNDQQ